MKRSQWKKQYKLKRRKSIFKNRFFFPTISSLIILGGISYLLFFSPALQVGGVEISGNQKAQTSDVLNAVNGGVEKNIFSLKIKSIILVNTKKVQKNILEYCPLIGQVDIKKIYPDKLSISIIERQPVAFIGQNDNYFYIDREGIIFEKISQPDEQKIKIMNSLNASEMQLGKQAIDKNLLEQILKIEAAFNQEMKIQPKEATILSEQRLNIKAGEGWETYFNLKGDLDWQVSELVLIVQTKIPPEKRNELGYIDLRFNKVFVFPQGLLAN